MVRLNVKHDRFTPPNWPAGFKLRIVALADIHACTTWMNVPRIDKIVKKANALKPDIVVLLGDYLSGMHLMFKSLPHDHWAESLARLKAPLGVHAVLGNHDWWEDLQAQARRGGPTMAGKALEEVGIKLYSNDVTRLEKDGYGFWLAGLESQLALLANRRYPRRNIEGLDDLEGTLAQVTTNEPIVMMAHEPNIFEKMPDRVAVTLSGHTHGGQVRVRKKAKSARKRYGTQYSYGHIVEDDRHLIVSGGLGYSVLPLRFGVPPEINLIELG
ncbi:metallophosphoesterase [Maritalea mediterranea]|uniref:Metallophosphoesterase n=1 Tax=Maritalea mediterranea TaxID=2909667 RepID=A0ABS9E9Y1_9HYPH|nr:metallophosphoesterase [Maritalea mediterranea]MCF4099681.1 metallophosphoesterase [Maritalea mediterranea]